MMGGAQGAWDYRRSPGDRRQPPPHHPAGLRSPSCRACDRGWIRRLKPRSRVRGRSSLRQTSRIRSRTVWPIPHQDRLPILRGEDEAIVQALHRVGGPTQLAHGRPSYRKPPEGEGFRPSQTETL